MGLAPMVRITPTGFAVPRVRCSATDPNSTPQALDLVGSLFEEIGDPVPLTFLH